MGEPTAGHLGAGSSVQNTALSGVQVGSVTGDIIFHRYPAPLSRPRQVPPPPADFVNRETELAELSRVLTAQGRDRRGVVVVTGLAGVGKTAMVHRWVADEGHRFTGGHLYVDFAAVRTESGAPVSDALAECLVALGVTREQIPSTLSGRAGMFRTKTALESVLVILDDVTEPAQVPPFVPNSAGSAVVVTSNERLSELALDGAYSLALGPLDPAGGESMLRAICGEDRLRSESSATKRLVQLSAGYPIALRVVAAQLAARPFDSVASLAAEFGDEESRLDALILRGERRVSEVFDSAYHRLPRPAAQLYRRLGATRFHTFTLDIAAVLLDTPRLRARRALDALLDTSLVEQLPGGRYLIHDLIRLHAAERSRYEDLVSDRGTTLARLFEHYLTTTAFADRAVMGARTRVSTKLSQLSDGLDPFQGAGRQAAALEWLTQERTNLLHVLRMMSEEGWHSSAWQLAEFLLALYFNRRYLDDWLQASEIGISSAQADGHPAAEARLRSVVSRAYTDIDDLDRAREHLEVALELATENGDNVLLASVWEFIGRFREKIDYDASIDAYRQAIERNREAGEQRGIALATYFMGRALSLKGDYPAALAALTSAHMMFVSIADDRMASRGSMSLGIAYYKSGQLEPARRELEHAATAFSRSHASHYEAEAREFLSQVDEHRGELRSAQENLRRVIEIRRASGVPDVEELVARMTRLQERFRA